VEKQSRAEVRRLVDSVAGTFGGVLALLSAIGVLAAPILVLLCAPGFKAKGAGQFELAVEMLRWTFPYLAFVSLTALAGGVLNSYREFALPALSSVVLNLVMILFAVWVAPYFDPPVLALAVGVFVGGVLQVAIQLPSLIRLRVVSLPRWDPQHEAVRRIARLMGPAILGSSMGQLSVMLSTAIASLLVDASMTWLYFADRLVEFPLGVFSIALATVILPSLSAHHARRSPAEFSATLTWALELVYLIVIPVSVALLVLAGPLTVVIYYRGAFTEQDVAMTRLALMAFSLALLGWSLIKVMAPGYYARQDTAGPVKIAVRALALTMVLNVVVLGVLAVLGHLRSPGMHALLALTNAVGAVFNAAMLYRGLVRQRILEPSSHVRGLLVRIVVASAVMAAVLLFLDGDMGQWLQASTAERVSWMGGLVVGGAAVYFACLWLLGVRAEQFRLPAAN
jgi:putative peptidoglycan lipid II flippase